MMKKNLVWIAAIAACILFSCTWHRGKSVDSMQRTAVEFSLSEQDQDSPENEPPKEYWTLFTQSPSAVFANFKDDSSSSSANQAAAGSSFSSPSGAVKSARRHGTYSFSLKPHLKSTSVIAFRKLLI
jgi:hypothetical protein